MNYNLGVKKNTGIRGAYCVVIFECIDHTLSQTKTSKKPHSLVWNAQAKKTKKNQEISNETSASVHLLLATAWLHSTCTMYALITEVDRGKSFLL